jgi:hypothetical protein
VSDLSGDSRWKICHHRPDRTDRKSRLRRRLVHINQSGAGFLHRRSALLTFSTSMKTIILMLLILTAPVHAGWFENKEDKQRIQQTEQQLAQQRQTTGTWQLIAGVFAVGGVVLFTVGTALGSKIRREARHDS